MNASQCIPFNAQLQYKTASCSNNKSGYCIGFYFAGLRNTKDPWSFCDVNAQNDTNPL